MAEFIYQMYQARKAHGDKVILDDVTLSFYPGAKIGVVGPNGMGKSTLLKIMAGIEEVSNGDARLTPGYTVGILQQEPPLDDDKTVIENVRMAFGDMIAKVDRFNKIGEEMCDPDCDMDALMAEMGKLQDEIDAADGWDIDSKLGQAMDALQLPDSDMPVNVLSGGERRRVALCKLLLEAPDLLLLDEPTNHLDAESILWLEHFLHNYQGAVLAVTHDRYFLDNVAEWICEVDRGHLYPYKGNYSTYLETKAARIEAQGNRDAKLAKRMEAELEWVRSSPKARQAKNKARLARYEEMEAEARASQKLDWTDIRIPVGPRLGNKVLEAHHLHKEFDGRVLIDDLSFTLPRNGIVGVIGPNGVGKTTSIGKIAASLKKQGKRVLLCAADTFRAAAADQLEIWAERAGCEIVRQYEGADPGAVLFDALQAAKARNVDVVLCDTAGRLHNKANLMAELAKLSKIIDRECPGCDRETLLVLDATTGQNGLIQARTFKETAGLTGIVLTKLDGTAKGGIVIAIARELGVPVKFAGVGEGIEDLRPFDPKAYVEAII